MKRKLFCEISPLTYKISTLKCQAIRSLKDIQYNSVFAKEKSSTPLPFVAYTHKSLIRRKLGNVDMVLQENKAANLSVAAPCVNGILIKPGQIFSFWHLVGNPTQKRGYKDGLVLSAGKTASGTGGGMCQFTNLIHWMILHSPLDICEHHHHDGYDLFPDFKRQIPFGTGTSIMYNYMDYRFKNNTNKTYQLITYTDNEYLCGELRCSEPQNEKYHIYAEDEHFEGTNGAVYRCGKVYRSEIDPKTGNCIAKILLRTNHARVMYNTDNLEISTRTDYNDMQSYT